MRKLLIKISFAFFIVVTLSIQLAKGQQIVGAEYFIGTDPGPGKGQPISITIPFDSSGFSFDIPTTSLTPGCYQLYIRVKNSSNIWSIQHQSTFWVTKTEKPDTLFTAIEYYFDNDKGKGNNNIIQLTTPTSKIEQTFNIPLFNIQEGFRNIGLRVLTNTNQSLYFSNSFYCFKPDTSAPIVGAEYFIDTVTGVNTGKKLANIQSTDTLTTQFDADIAGKSGGVHSVYVVVKDSRGRSSQYKAGSFTICDVLPVADFKAVFNPFDTSVVFTNLSTNYDGSTVFEWDLDGNGVSDYTGSSNIKKYNAYNIYNVRLIASNTALCRDTIIKSVVVDPDTCKISASFTATPDLLSNVVAFTNTSTGNVGSSYWDFGDGSTSTKTSPIKTYSKAGYYTATLSIKKTNSTCTDIYSEVVKVGTTACKAFFTYTKSTTSKEVQFTNQSLGSTLRYFWYFDDGSYSTDESPKHLYSADGIYKVSLSISNESGDCSNQFTLPVIIGSGNCDARYTYFVNSDLTVNFSSSINEVGTQYLWSFGDGGQSTQLNPVHKYKRAGIYAISLNVYNPEKNCSDNSIQNIPVGDISNICDADFIFQSTTNNTEVKFFDNSKGDIIGYVWNFGDGQIAAGGKTVAGNPVHNYNVPGYYNVCQLVVNATMLFDMKCKPVVAQTSSTTNCYADFNYIIDTATSKVSFIDISDGSPNSWTWDFGNSASSKIQNPVTTYTKAGYYLVKLSIANSANTCSDINYKLININQPQVLKAGFGYKKLPKSTKAGGYPIDFIGAGLGDQAKLKWNFGDGSTDTTTTTPTHEYDNTGKYTVCYEVFDQVSEETDKVCEDVIVDQVDIATSEEIKGNIEAYPNPFENRIKVAYNLESAGMANIRIINLDGRSNYTLLSNYKQAGQYNFEWNTNHLSGGTYIVLLQVNNNIVHYQVIIKK